MCILSTSDMAHFNSFREKFLKPSRVLHAVKVYLSWIFCSCCIVLQDSTFGCFENFGIVNPRSLERSLKKGQLSPVVLPWAGTIGTGVRGFGMRSADLKLRSAIPICAAISQPASGNGIISVRQGRVGPPFACAHELISWCSPGGEHLGGFRRPIWGQGYAAGNWR